MDTVEEVIAGGEVGEEGTMEVVEQGSSTMEVVEEESVVAVHAL